LMAATRQRQGIGRARERHRREGEGGDKRRRQSQHNASLPLHLSRAEGWTGVGREKGRTHPPPEPTRSVGQSASAGLLTDGLSLRPTFPDVSSSGGASAARLLQLRGQFRLADRPATDSLLVPCGNRRLFRSRLSRSLQGGWRRERRGKRPFPFTAL